MSIRLKMLLAIIVAVIVTLGSVVVTISLTLEKAFVDNFAMSSSAQLDRATAYMNLFFKEAVDDATIFAADPAFSRALGHLTSYKDVDTAVNIKGANLPPVEAELYASLLRMQQVKSEFYSSIYIGDSTAGMTFAPEGSLGPNYDPSQRPWFIATLNAGKTTVTDAYISDNGDIICTVTSPVPSNGNVKGVIGIDISLSTLTTELGQVRLGKTGYTVLIDHSGQVLVAADKNWLGKEVSDLPKDAAAVFKSLLTKGSGLEEVVLDGEDWFAGVRTTNEHWTLIMLQTKKEIFAEAYDLVLSLSAVGFGIIAAMALFAYALSRTIAGPVTVLAQAASNVAAGDLNAIPDQGKGFTAELGVLHTSLKRMVEKLTELIGHAESKVREAEISLQQAHKSAEEAEQAKLAGEQARHQGILEVANQLASIVGQVAGAADKLAEEQDAAEKNVDHQRQRVAENAAAMSQMNIAIGEVASSISQTSHLADTARQQSRSGKQVVLDMVNSIHQVEKESNAMGESLQALGIQATDIGKIMSVINDIADQTNLLALNAAIEAARAGDAGRGFAVVADEVRKLAENTMQATKQVGEAITSIQKGTNDNVHAMQNTAQLVNRSADLAQQAGDALAQIEGMVDQTADQVRAIAAATEEQSATAEEISRGTEAVSQAADEVSNGTKRSKAAVHELVELSNQVEKIIDNLRKS